jgi:hypothetical protein
MFAQESIDDLAARTADWISTLDAPPPPKKRRAIRFLFVLVVIFGVWRLLQRPGRRGGSQHEEPETAPTPDPTSEVAEEAPSPPAGRAADPTPAPLKLTDPRYAVKWTDCSEGQEVPHEKRDLTFSEAQKEAAWFLHHNRRFYPGDEAKRSPFARLQVWLQCLCGRDVVDLRDPHTVPADDRVCPYSGTGKRRAALSRTEAPTVEDPAPRPVTRIDATARPITGGRSESDRIASARRS